jgi:hypothetical protein
MNSWTRPLLVIAYETRNGAATICSYPISPYTANSYLRFPPYARIVSG